MVIIRKIKNLFDYMYYRIYKFYYKWDKDTGITAAIGLSMFQSTSLAVIIILFIKILYNKSEMVGNSKNISLGWGLIFLVLTFINDEIYSTKVKKNLENKWKQELSEIKKKTRLVNFFTFIISVAYSFNFRYFE